MVIHVTSIQIMKLLKSLLNTPHPSGKLARWGLAIQELDLHIHYRAGRLNQAADALSHIPVPDKSPTTVASAQDREELVNEVCTTSCMYLSSRQEHDVDLKVIRDYLLNNELPSDDKKAREIALKKSEFEIIDGVLYHVEKDKTLRIVPPSQDRRELFESARAGVFGGHLKSAKLHGQLAKHYWWPGM